MQLQYMYCDFYLSHKQATTYRYSNLIKSHKSHHIITFHRV